MKKFAPLLVLLFLLLNCGSNIFSPITTSGTSRGDEALESEDYETAITEFEAAFQQDPSSSVKEKLASAYMGRCGMGILALIEKTTSSSETGVNGMLEFTPEATAQNISDINRAVELLEGIVEPNPTQTFQKGIAQTTQAFLVIKQVLAATEAGLDIEMTEEQALQAINGLTGAASSFATVGSDDGADFGGKIDEINAQIEAEGGGAEGLSAIVNEAMNE